MLYAIIFLVIAAGFIVISYNKLIYSKNKVDNSWGQIDIQLKRRFDLIPNLVETVKGYAAHEEKVLTEVSEARYKYMNATDKQGQMSANTEMSGALSRLFAVSENYPDLKSNENFLQLQKELTNTEDKITFSRQIYNDVVMDYNNAIQMFPGSIIAGMFNFKPTDYFRVEESDKQAPTIKF